MPVCWQNRPRAPAPAQLSWHQRSGSTITGTHTLWALPSHLHPWGQKPNVERQKGGMITLNGEKARFWGLLASLVEGISVGTCVCVSLHTCRCVTKSMFVRECLCSDDPCMHTRLNTLQQLWIEMGWCQDFEGGVVSRLRRLDDGGLIFSRGGLGD